MNGLITTIVVDGARVHLLLTRYPSGNVAIRAVDADTGEDFAMLSLNTNEALEDGVFYMKDYSENEELAKSAIDSGAFIAVNKFKQVGFRTVQAWRIDDGSN